MNKMISTGLRTSCYIIIRKGTPILITVLDLKILRGVASRNIYI